MTSSGSPFAVNVKESLISFLLGESLLIWMLKAVIKSAKYNRYGQSPCHPSNVCLPVLSLVCLLFLKG